jgi:hypothetical protein
LSYQATDLLPTNIGYYKNTKPSWYDITPFSNEESFSALKTGTGSTKRIQPSTRFYGNEDAKRAGMSRK